MDLPGIEPCPPQWWPAADHLNNGMAFWINVHIKVQLYFPNKGIYNFKHRFTYMVMYNNIVHEAEINR
jgi:hypothetical protein